MAHVRAPPRLSRPLPRLADRLVLARDPLPARQRPRPGADGRRHQRDRRRSGHTAARPRDRGDRRPRPRSRSAHVRPTHDLGTSGARRRVRPPRRALLALPPPLVRLLRPQPDGPAHVARDDRPAGRALLPRLRAHLLRAARGDDRGRHRRAVRLQLEARLHRARDHADHRGGRVPLQPGFAARPARSPAEARRGFHRRRGVDHRRPRREVVRAGGASRGSTSARPPTRSSSRRSPRTGSGRCTCRS